MDFIGNSDLPGSFCQNPVLRGSSLSGIYIRNRCLCVDDACGNLWIMVVEQADGKEKIRLWMMVFFMVLGIISEIFINPNFSALIFQLF